MSFRKEHSHLITNFDYSNQSEFSNGFNFENKAPEELNLLFGDVFKDGMHGLCFSLYEDGQKPGDIISEEQVRRRMAIIAPYTKWVRSFSCTEGNEYIPIIAKEFGIKTLVGAWLGDNPEVNEREIEGLIKLANDGFVDIAAVGNEVMYRKDLSEARYLPCCPHRTGRKRSSPRLLHS